MNKQEKVRDEMTWLNRKKFAVGLALALATAGYHAARYAYRPVTSAAPLPAVHAEASQAGHAQIGLDERGLEADAERLTFARLGEWAYDPQRPTSCPETVRAADKRRVTVTGFMYPLETGKSMRTFCLLRTTQTCCYGPRPQYNQYLFVEMRRPVAFERFAPVTVAGRFVVDPQPTEGYVYRLEGDALVSANEDRPEADAEQTARELKLPRFDFGLLAGQAKSRAAAFPAALTGLDGRRVVADGFVLDPRAQPEPHLTLALRGWNGKTPGAAPTLETAMTVFMTGPGELPPAWQPRGVFIGTLHVIRDPARWKSEGIVCLRYAVRAETALGGPKNRRVPVSFFAEALAWAAYLFWIIRGRKNHVA